MITKLLRKPAAIALFCGVGILLTVLGLAVSSSGLSPLKSKNSVQVNAASLAQSMAAGSSLAMEPAVASLATQSSSIIKPENATVSSVTGGINIDRGPALESQIAPQVFDTITRGVSGNTIDFNNRKLCNNEWGAALEESLKCAVYLSPNNTFGWYWDRKTPLYKPGVNGVLPIYPSVRAGGSPWEKSNSVYFPVKLGDVKSLMLSLTYKYTTIPEGEYDFAYDMFLTETDQASSNPKRNAEVMIWIHRTLAAPASSYKGDYSDGINNYELYSYQMADGRLYYAFIMKGSPVFEARHTVNAGKLLDALNLNAGWYIPGIELGNEVIDGAGKVEISQFDVTLNGQNS
jgi:hypothetical protein